MGVPLYRGFHHGSSLPDRDIIDLRRSIAVVVSTAEREGNPGMHEDQS
ncbi:hypothetical protein ACFQS5_18520 [Salinirubellus sp. GCM10025899]